MTDEEIIKCLNDTVGKEHTCIYCTDKKGNYTATVKLTDITNLIHRQKAEIEELKASNKARDTLIIEQNDEIARLESLTR